MPETLVVRDCHFNRALVVLEDVSLSLREFYVPLRGPDFDLSLFQLLKFCAGHVDLLHAPSEICAKHPRATGYFAIGKSRTRRRLPRTQGIIRLPAGKVMRPSAHSGSCRRHQRRSPGNGLPHHGPVRFRKNRFHLLPIHARGLCLSVCSCTLLVDLSSGQFFARIAKPGKQRSDRRHVCV